MKLYYYEIPYKILIAANINLDYRRTSSQDLVSIHSNSKLRYPDLLIIYCDHELYSKEEDSEKAIKVGRYITFIPDNTLIYRQNFLGSRVQMIVRNLKSRPTYFYIYRNSERVAKIPLPMRDLARPLDVQRALIQVKLIQKGSLEAHGAGLVSPYGNIIATAYPDTGKTTTALKLSRIPGFKVLSDDIVYINQKGTFTGLGFSGDVYLGFAEKTLVSRAEFEFRKNIGTLLGYLAYIPYSPSSLKKLASNIVSIKSEPLSISYFGEVMCNYFFILENGKEEVLPIERETATKKFLEINRREHYYFDNNFILLSYSYFSKYFDFNYYLLKRYEIIHDFLRKADTYIIRSRNPSDYAKLILKVIKH